MQLQFAKEDRTKKLIRRKENELLHVSQLCCGPLNWYSTTEVVVCKITINGVRRTTAKDLVTNVDIVMKKEAIDINYERFNGEHGRE